MFDNGYGLNGKAIKQNNDNIRLPHKPEQQISIINLQPKVAILISSAYYWHSWTGDPDNMQDGFVHEITNDPNAQVNKPLKTEEFLPLFLKRRVLPPPTTSLLVRREVAERICGFEESFPSLFEDQVFIAKVSLDAPIVLLRGVYELYRQHMDSCTFIAQKITGENLKMRLTYLNWQEEYMSALEIKDANLWKTLRKALFEYRHPVLWAFVYHSKRFVVLMEDRAKNIIKKVIPGL